MARWLSAPGARARGVAGIRAGTWSARWGSGGTRIRPARGRCGRARVHGGPADGGAGGAL